MKLTQGQINKLMRRGYEMQARMAGIPPGEIHRVDTDAKGRQIVVHRKPFVERNKYSPLYKGEQTHGNQEAADSGPLFQDPAPEEAGQEGSEGRAAGQGPG